MFAVVVMLKIRELLAAEAAAVMTSLVLWTIVFVAPPRAEGSYNMLAV